MLQIPQLSVKSLRDIITKITSKNKSFDVDDIEDFIKIVESFDTGEIILIIGTRGGANIFEPVKLNNLKRLFNHCTY